MNSVLFYFIMWIAFAGASTRKMPLVHLADQRVDLVLAVAGVAALNEVLHLLVAEAARGAAQLERPQEVAGLLEVRADGDDLVHQVLHTDDAELAQRLLNDGVVAERNALLLHLAEPALVDQLTDGLQVGRAPGHKRLHQLEHLQRAVVQAHEHARVDLAQTEQLQDLARLRRDLVDTLDADDERQLLLSRAVVAAVGLGLAAQADLVALGVAVLVDVLLGALEDDLSLLLVGLCV